jgi:hypothetical protein
MLWGQIGKMRVNWAMPLVFKAKLDNRNPRNSGGITGSQDIYGSSLIDKSVNI